MNKIMLEHHCYTIDNDAIDALRLVKDSIRKEGGVDKCPVTRKLLNYSSKVRMQCFSEKNRKCFFLHIYSYSF